MNSQSRHGSDTFELTVTGDGDGRRGEDGFRRKLDCARSMGYTSEPTLGAHTDDWSLPARGETVRVRQSAFGRPQRQGDTRTHPEHGS